MVLHHPLCDVMVFDTFHYAICNIRKTMLYVKLWLDIDLVLLTLVFSSFSR